MNCQAELRGLGAITDDLHDLGVTIVALSTDPPERSRTVVERNHLPFPILADEDGRIIDHFGLRHVGGGPRGTDIAIPAHILIGADRRIRWRHVARRIHDRLPADRVLASVRASL
jgi:peroxiredoxin